jgi:hypothetical protein
MRVLPLAIALSLLVGCAAQSMDSNAARDAWQARDAERAAECRRQGGRFFGGSCNFGGR